ncbi:protein mab-21-like [Teleopsis dalmanni]|uniref:protein mab-21-like n=1 Tax=Teleopsis dalmanni TaxID=139649 RepID=UPI0018CF27B7|nr:protein mab-21-like [Teleopsis dalmanni]
MDNLENILKKINLFINIDKERNVYTNHFNCLRKAIYDKLREDDVFKSLSAGTVLEGSYGDNLKVKSPDEFDLVFYIKFPETKSVTIKKDSQIAGNIFIDTTAVIKIIEKQVHHANTLNCIKKMVTKDNNLIIENMHAWLQSLFQKTMNSLQEKIIVNEVASKLRYIRCGPAHTIKVTGPCTYSVDFVPAILLEPHQDISGKKIKSNWQAIPKPLKTASKKPQISFRTSYYQEENRIISNKNNLKNVLRFMKKFRDTHPNMSNLKSYYIKTIFLWKAHSKNNDNKYWNNSLSDILLEMFTELELHLTKKKLPYYWDAKLDLFKHLQLSQFNEMLNCTMNARKTLAQAKMSMTPKLQFQTYAVFLNEKERQETGIEDPK